MSEEMWAGVRERVEALRDRPGSERVFGAPGHGWELDPALSEAELTGLESALGVRLPEDYRGFLRHVGAGGAGPSYGVFPVRREEREASGWAWDGDGADLADPGRLAEPFPERGPAPELLERLFAARPEEEDFLVDGAFAEDAFDTAMEDWEERWAAVLLTPERTVGALVLCHLGCALRQWLVVSGVHRGTMWSDDRADDQDLAPLLDATGAPLTFARWYLDWLDAAERETGAVPAR
ncbi:SMI1/KNR4 family protein [Streptomyces sp. NPDC048290]|uniref:SMI1/KNR4 family protein n=1 Tax=Streptomyces sp. NPDC048290 TaxID=3155811 RepID=UPI00343A5BED